MGQAGPEALHSCMNLLGRQLSWCGEETHVQMLNRAVLKAHAQLQFRLS